MEMKSIASVLPGRRLAGRLRSADAVAPCRRTVGRAGAARYQLEEDDIILLRGQVVWFRPKDADDGGDRHQTGGDEDDDHDNLSFTIRPSRVSRISLPISSSSTGLPSSLSQKAERKL